MKESVVSRVNECFGVLEVEGKNKVGCGGAHLSEQEVAMVTARLPGLRVVHALQVENGDQAMHAGNEWNCRRTTIATDGKESG